MWIGLNILDPFPASFVYMTLEKYGDESIEINPAWLQPLGIPDTGPRGEKLS
jgi:hypothetical protein